MGKRASGLDHHPGKGRVLCVMKILPDSGRTLDISYPWKSELPGRGRRVLEGAAKIDEDLNKFFKGTRQPLSGA
jgi:hypothetical protein